MEAPAVAGVSAAEGGQHGVGLAAFCWQTWQEELQAGACPVPLHEWWVALLQAAMHPAPLQEWWVASVLAPGVHTPRFWSALT
eukprot:scaffold258056_cov18-Tisochrysis_lutea.AAC.1